MRICGRVREEKTEDRRTHTPPSSRFATGEAETARAAMMAVKKAVVCILLEVWVLESGWKRVWMKRG
jgi:hypothetical protein